MLKKSFVIFLILSLTYTNARSQDITVLLKEAANLELKFKEPEALEKYKQVLLLDEKNYLALQKSTILFCQIGTRLGDKKERKLYYETALNYAKKAFDLDSNLAESWYLLSVVNGRLAENDDDNKKRILYAKNTKVYADKALALNPNHVMANFVVGKWHYEMIVLSWVKKMAIKTIYGGMPEPSIETSILYLEKCRKLDPYFTLAYLTLAKAYKENDNNNKYLEILNLLVKLPRRTFDDASYISEGKKLLEEEK